MTNVPARRPARAPARTSAAFADVAGEPQVPIEWAETATLIDNLWKDEFDGWRAVSYVEAWTTAGYEPGEVQAAVTELAGRPGGAWLPSCQEISAVVHARRRIGTFDWADETVTQVLADAVTRLEGTGREDEIFYAESVSDDVARHLVAVDAEHGPILVTYLTALGGPYGRLCVFGRARRLAWARAVQSHAVAQLHR